MSLLARVRHTARKRRLWPELFTCELEDMVRSAFGPGRKTDEIGHRRPRKNSSVFSARFPSVALSCFAGSRLELRN